MPEGQEGPQPRSPEEIAAIDLGKRLNTYFGQFPDETPLAEVLPTSLKPTSVRWERILTGLDSDQRPRAIRAVHGIMNLTRSSEPSLREADLNSMGGVRHLSRTQLREARSVGPITALAISEALRRIEPQQPQNIIQESFNRP